MSHENDNNIVRRAMFSRNKWLIYTEIFAIIGFIVLAAIYTQRGSGASKTPWLSNADTILSEADNFYEKQDLAKAIHYYWQALQAFESQKNEANEKQRLHANLRIAEIYSQKNWLIDAKSRIKAASYIQSDHIDLLLLKGKLYRDEGLQEEATNQFLMVYEKKPNHAETNYLLGVLYQGRKQYEDASSHYLLAIKNDPDYLHIPSEKAPIGILARLQLSRTYNKMWQKYQFVDRELTQDDYDEVTRLEAQSIILLKEALQIKPDMQEIKDDLIRLLYVRAKALSREAATRPYADALEVYEQIVELDPTEVQAWQEMAEIYESYLRDLPKALEMYQKVYELEPHATFLAIIKSIEEEINSLNQKAE